MQKGPLATIGGGPFSISYNPIDSGFRHHVDLDARRDVLVHTDRCRVNTDETNILVNGNIAAVDLESTLGQFHRNLLRGHGTKMRVSPATLPMNRNPNFSRSRRWAPAPSRPGAPSPGGCATSPRVS